MAAAKSGRADDVVELIGQGADIDFMDEVRDLQCRRAPLMSVLMVSG